MTVGAIGQHKVDHVLVTRFNLPSIGTESLIRAQDGWLQERVELFERYTISSVSAQSTRNFFWIVYFDPESPTWLIERLQPSVDAGTFIPLFRERVDWQQLLSDCREVTGALSGMLLTTNLDNDDGIASNFVARLQESVTPGFREALFIGNGLIRHEDRLYYRKDHDNAFCSVAEPWEGAVTAWRDWHVLLSRHMRAQVLEGPPGWLQVVHSKNVSNRVRGRLVDPRVYGPMFSGSLDDLPTPTVGRVAADRLILRPIRECREALRLVAKKAVLATSGKAGLDRFKERLATVRRPMRRRSS